MRHNLVQRSEIVAAKVDLLRAKQSFECLLADSDVQPEYAGSVKLRDTIIFIIGSGNRGERKLAVGATEKESVSKILCDFDPGKGVSDVLGD